MTSPVEYSDEELQIICNEFSRLNSVTYLDHTGSCLYPKSLIESISEDLCTNTYSNPHSNSTCSQITSDCIDLVRFRILQHFNTDQNEYSVIFTSGATAALKLVSEAFVWNRSDMNDAFNWDSLGPDKKNDAEKGDFVYLNDSHTSVLGMRSTIEENGVFTKCLTTSEAFDVFNSDTTLQNNESDSFTNSLLVYPAQCNFSGLKYPLSWIEKTHKGSLNSLFNRKRSNWYCLLDAATFLSTNPLDLSVYKPDFVCLSFYKIFGYPTGLGALIVKNSSADVLEKKYYGGGSVLIALSSKNCFVPRPLIHEKFEDGTLNFLSIVSLRHGFNVLDRLTGDMKRVSRHCFLLAKFAFDSLLKLHHSNGKPVVELYTDTCYDNEQFQGGIVAFNLLRPNGEYVGFVEVLHQANLHIIQLRTGCFCNSGACWRHLNLSQEDVKSHYQAGHVCGDDKDLVNGQPTGAVRISFGYYSKRSDVDKFLKMIESCFVQEPSIKKIPDYWKEKMLTINQRLANNCGQKNEKNNSLKINHRLGNDTYGLFKNLANTVDSNNVDGLKMSKDPVLSNIFVYPVKSCGAYSVKSWQLDSRGLAYDRIWMIVNSSGVALTQKKEPKMCLIKPRLDLIKRQLILCYEGTSFSISVDINKDAKEWNGNFCQSKICGDRIDGFDCGDDVASWLSNIFQLSGLRLIRQHSRTTLKKSSLSLANQGQYLLVSATSVNWLSDQITSAQFNKKTFIDRFRGNFVINNIVEPFVELSWNKVNIGNSEFKVDGGCNRCQMICIDQETGETNKEPLMILGAAMKGKLKFGIYLSHLDEKPVTLSVGDSITYS